MTVFTFAQPFLVTTTIRFVEKKNPDINHGKGLIGAWALVYLGIAVSHHHPVYVEQYMSTDDPYIAVAFCVQV